MQFESQWPGDAIAAPFCPKHVRENALLEGHGGGSWSRIDSRADLGDAELRRSQCAAINWDITRNEPIRCLSKPNPWGRRVAAVTSWVITAITSIVAELWSKMRREREIRRISAAWETIDDRTLKDIGICRCEIEYGRDARHWS